MAVVALLILDLTEQVHLFTQVDSRDFPLLQWGGHNQGARMFSVVHIQPEHRYDLLSCTVE